MSSDAAHQLNMWPRNQRGEYVMMHMFSESADAYLFPNSHLSDGGNYCLCQAAKERERRRECSRLSTAVLWEPSPHTPAISLGQVGDGARETPDSSTCSRQSRVHPSPPPLAKPCVNNIPLNDFLKLLAKHEDDTVIHQNGFRVYWWSWICIYFLYFIYLLNLYIYLSIYLFVSFIETDESEQKIMPAKIDVC